LGPIGSNIGPSPNVKKGFPQFPNSVVIKLFVKAFSNDIFTLMSWFLFVLINQAKYYAQDTGNQYSILGRLICLPDCDKTSENESGNL
jgi:hypothetical protein